MSIESETDVFNQEGQKDTPPVMPTPEVEPEDIPCFTLVRKEKKVRLDSGDGKTAIFILRECSGPDRAAFQNNVGSRVRTLPGSTDTYISNHAGLQEDLIARCMYQADGVTKVKESALKTWPASILDGLFKLCQQLNGLGQGSEDAAKNS